MSFVWLLKINSHHSSVYQLVLINDMERVQFKLKTDYVDIG